MMMSLIVIVIMVLSTCSGPNPLLCACHFWLCPGSWSSVLFIPSCLHRGSVRSIQWVDRHTTASRWQSCSCTGASFPPEPISFPSTPQGFTWGEKCPCCVLPSAASPWEWAGCNYYLFQSCASWKLNVGWHLCSEIQTSPLLPHHP